RRALADPLDLLELLGGELAEIGRLGGDGLRRALVGADPERLWIALLEHRELGELAQHVEDVLLGIGHVRDGSVTQTKGRWCSLYAVAKAEAAEVLSVEGREVRITNPGKLYFTKETKLTKLEVVRYYLSVAEGALAGIRDRPIVLKRFVDGADG